MKKPVAAPSSAQKTVSELVIAPNKEPTTITTVEAAELLGISVPTFQKRLAGPDHPIKVVGKDGKANLFDLDAVLAYSETVKTRSATNKPDPMVRMHEIAAAYLARNVPVWLICHKKTHELLGLLPGKTEEQAMFNAKRRFKDVETYARAYEAPAGSTPSAGTAITEAKS